MTGLLLCQTVNVHSSHPEIGSLCHRSVKPVGKQKRVAIALLYPNLSLTVSKIGEGRVHTKIPKFRLSERLLWSLPAISAVFYNVLGLTCHEGILSSD